MNITIWFDMDGTIADLYGVPDWLARIQNNDASPYVEARPLCNMQVLARLLNKAQRQGYRLGVCSWCSKTGSPEFDEEVKQAKRKWLARHLASVQWDYLDIVAYGVPKEQGRAGILFDDEERHRRAWGYWAYDADEMIKTLKELIQVSSAGSSLVVDYYGEI